MFELMLNDKFVKHLADYIDDRLYILNGRTQQLPYAGDIKQWIRDAEKIWKQKHPNLKVE